MLRMFCIAFDDGSYKNENEIVRCDIKYTPEGRPPVIQSIPKMPLAPPAAPTTISISIGPKSCGVDAAAWLAVELPLDASEESFLDLISAGIRVMDERLEKKRGR
jgi:hypothetical protein